MTSVSDLERDERSFEELREMRLGDIDFSHAETENAADPGEPAAMACA